jgi:hypothetical protein
MHVSRLAVNVRMQWSISSSSSPAVAGSSLLSGAVPPTCRMRRPVGLPSMSTIPNWELACRASMTFHTPGRPAPPYWLPGGVLPAGPMATLID